MNKFKYIVSFSIIIFSFYFTDELMNFIDNKNPIMQNILSVKDEYELKPVNAIIKDNTIIPGIMGKTINSKKSFDKMSDFGKFNDLFLVYNNINPEISLNDNKDKIIIRGNSIKREVALIIDNNLIIKDYLNELDINYNETLLLGDNILNNIEYINVESNKKDFSDLNSILNKKKINSNICLIGYSNYEYCLDKKFYLVSFSLNASGNIIDVINNINSGEIIYVDSKVSLDNFKLILNEINKQDLKIVLLSKLISE